MERNRKIKLMISCSIATGVLVELFWAIWYLKAGQIPTVNSIKIPPDRTIELPFEISRWWDILAGSIWPIILISIFTSEKISKKIQEISKEIRYKGKMAPANETLVLKQA